MITNVNKFRGGNITDISQEEGIKLITKYWSNKNSPIESNVFIVGDVHGDLHQFLAPLIMSGIMILNNDIIEEKHKYPESSLFLPSYKLIKDESKKIIYLGDMIDEWIFNRQIARILRNLLETTNNIIYIYGNHDLALIGRYFLFKDKKINIPYDLPPLWETLKSELNYNKNVKIYADKIEYNGDLNKGLDFLNDYLESLFEDMYTIFSKCLGKLSQVAKINNIPFMISHSTWTQNALKQLLINKYNIKSDRPGDSEVIQTDPIIRNYKIKDESKIILNNVIQSLKNGKTPETEEEYNSLSLACNDLFNSQSRLFISKNGITYTRNKETIFLNQITGHTAGSEMREIDVNVKPSKFYNERIGKLTPDIINDKKIYYFDFNCSAGYDHDEISRPDFVYISKDGLNVTNLPSFNFIISNKQHSMIVSSDKTLHSNNKVTINMYR